MTFSILFLSNRTLNLLKLSMLFMTLIITACSGGGSGNGPDPESDTDPVECSDGFGDSSRCNTRGGF